LKLDFVSQTRASHKIKKIKDKTDQQQIYKTKKKIKMTFAVDVS